MNENVEALRQKALEAKNAKALNQQAKAKQVAEDSKKNIREEMESGHQKLGQLELSEAELAAQVSQLEHEIKTAQQRLGQIEKEDRPNVENDEAFEGEEELRKLALKLLDDEKEQLSASLPDMSERLKLVQRQYKEARAEIKSILGKAKGYRGERELPKGKMSEVWRFVEEQRRVKNNLYSYANHAKTQARSLPAQLQESTNNKVVFEYNEGRAYLWGIPADIFNNPRFYNEYVDSFRQEIDLMSQNESGRLSEQQIEALKKGRLKLKFAGKEVLIYDGENPVVPQEVSPPEFLATLSENERKIVQEAVLTYEDRENLEKRLRLSEYREDVLGEIKKEAEDENAEYNKRTLEQKLPELETKLAAAQDALTQQEAEYNRFNQIVELLPQANQLLTSIWRSKSNIDHYEKQITALAKQIKELQKERDGIGKTFFGNSKDQASDKRLAGRIEEHSQTIIGQEKYQTDSKSALAQKEAELDLVASKLNSLEHGLIDELKALPNEDLRRSVEYRLRRQMSDIYRQVNNERKNVSSLELAFNFPF